MEKSRHFQAGVFFATAVVYVNVLLLATWNLPRGVVILWI